MNIVIDIPKNNYLYAKEGYMCGPDIIVSAIKNGTPLELEQTDLLDKIRADIADTTSRYTISRECGAMGHVEWSDRLIKESEVLQIIDKYKGVKRESEDNK